MSNLCECSTAEQYLSWLEIQSTVPTGFKVGTTSFGFTPQEFNKEVKMSLTVIAADHPTTSFSAMFTKNAFPGAPVIIGRERLKGDSIKALVINNKVSNVGVLSGVEDSEAICDSVASALGCKPEEIFPSSTGVIGWRLPVRQMTEALPQALHQMQSESILPAAKAIMTTDLYPKVRRAELRAPDGSTGSIVAIAKGAGMIEPNLATMLVFILSDIEVERGTLNQVLKAAVEKSFNSISIDSDQSTSDSVFCLSSNRVRGIDINEFASALTDVCEKLAGDIVRNGEGVHHVIEVQVSGATSQEIAKGIGKAIVNSPLVKTAVAGNDPNVGRLMAAIGSYIGNNNLNVNLNSAEIKLGEELIFKDGFFVLSKDKEQRISEYLKGAELYSSDPALHGGMFHPPINWPSHQRSVLIRIDLNDGVSQAHVWGGDLTHEYVSENADYRS